MRRTLLITLLGLCSFSLNYALYYYQGENEKGVQPNTLIISNLKFLIFIVIFDKL